jgi:hypothetical protein
VQVFSGGSLLQGHLEHCAAVEDILRTAVSLPAMAALQIVAAQADIVMDLSHAQGGLKHLSLACHNLEFGDQDTSEPFLFTAPHSLHLLMRVRSCFLVRG